MGKIILEDFSKGDGHYKVDLACLSKEQVEEIETLVSTWKPTDEDIKACIGMCLTDVNEQRFKDYGTNLRDCLAWLEKQVPKPQGKTALEAIHEKKVDNANKVELMYHKDDWIIHPNTGIIYQVVACIDNQYQLKYGEHHTFQKCADVDRCTRLWTIQDAKDGDILVSEYNKPFIYNGKYISDSIGAHCGINIHDQFIISPTEYNWTDYKVEPATKEQRNLLFQKMKEMGWEWDAEKKKLKRMQKANWSGEDSKAIDNCCLLIAAADDSYEKSFKDDCIHYLQNLKQQMTNDNKR